MNRPRLPWFITRHVLFALVVGSLGGVAFMVFLIEFDHFTSSAEFCTTCHSMKYAQQTYEQSVHFRSDSGVRAGCGDCHVSQGVFAATWDHAVGTKDLIKQVLGKVVGPDYDDPVVNALHLPESAFAAREWFRKTDSATCERCHVLPAILGKRPDTVQIHSEDARGRTCVDCHYNLVHRKVPDEKTFKRNAWNAMIEEEFQLAPGTASRLLAE
jgi:nitrate/TMAO reductase-like tetraheme cytochrome c subunit